MKYLHLVFLDRRVSSKSLFAVWLLVISGFGAGIANADDVVVPNAQEILEGNSSDCVPLSGCSNADRFQQVYDSTQFSEPGPFYITKLAFRPDAFASPFMGQSFSDVEINLSTTSAVPDALSATFATNYGGDLTTVYSGALNLLSFNTGGTPKDFDVEITLQTPFLYDPASGNALFEFKNVSGEGGGAPMAQLDSENTSADSISRALCADTALLPCDIMDPSETAIGFTSTSGLVTKFTFFPPDELSLEDLQTQVGADFPVVNVPNFFEQRADVTKAGLTSADFCVGLDPREGRRRFKRKFLNVSELSFTGSCGDLSEINLRIPHVYRGFKGEFDGEVGVWLVVALIQSTAEVLGPVEVETFHDALIDYSASLNPPGCNTALAFRELSLGGAVAAFGDHLNVETRRMIPETALCTSGRSLTRRTAHVYPVRLDAVPNEEDINAQRQLDGINDTIAEAAVCVDSTALPVIALLQSSLDSADSAFAQGQYADGVADLEQIARDAKFNSNNFSGCPTDRNYVGNFMARGLVAAFTFWDRFLHPDEGPSWAVYPVPLDLDVFD